MKKKKIKKKKKKKKNKKQKTKIEASLDGLSLWFCLDPFLRELSRSSLRILGALT